MKCVIPEIAYHNRDPVLSVDFQLGGEGSVTRLATAGSDTHVVIWGVQQAGDGEVTLDCLSDLTRHQRAVNIVRWGQAGAVGGPLLASGDDESVIIVWQLRQAETAAGLFDDEAENKENWVVYKMIRFHLDDVYDLSWSPCGQFLLSGSVDNTAIISNVHKNSKVAHLSESRGYIQGVSWNKKYNLVSSLGGDRACRTYNGTNGKLLCKTYKSVLDMKERSKSKKKVENSVQTDETKSTTVVDPPEVEGKDAGKVDKLNSKSQLKEKEVRFFHDETFKGFFRRLCWSNDGELLVVPSGVMETEGDSKVSHCCWVFSRLDLTKPALCLPTKDKYTTAVRFSPQLYKLRLPKKASAKCRAAAERSSEPWLAAGSVFCLPYRQIYAVATQNAIMFYDTQQTVPFGRVSSVHYTGLTDITWSPCGNIVIASSSDGYCSIVTFSPGELGELYTDQMIDQSPAVENIPMNSKAANSTYKKPNEATEKVKRVPLTTLSSPKVDKNNGAKEISIEKKCLDIEEDARSGEAGCVPEAMETDAAELSLVLEETQPEMPEPAAESKEANKKRAVLTAVPTIASTKQSSTPEKTKGRRVSLITLSSPKVKK